ncbi:ABC transporter ATP-binding protein [Ligilactobacillus ceti]|uniref:ABC transporter ATP-binding protein n=1 Tax=Ligilactobacillus ceti TaxID=395085 RepID=UPI000400F782|nr:ABC transporter transmembrane domain-containing protein [Ligilactobacillus ceti]
MSIFKKLSWFFKKEKGLYIRGVIALILVAALNVIPPHVIGLIVNKLNQHQISLTYLFFAVSSLIVIGFLQYLLRYLWRRYIFGGSLILERNLRSRIFKHYMKMDRTFYQKHRIGDLMAHATNDIDAVRDVSGMGILTLADSIITGVATLLAMCIFVDFRLTLLAIIPLPFLALMASLLGKKIHSSFMQSQAAFSELNNKTQESVLGVKVIKALGQEKEDTQDFKKYIQRAIHANKKAYLLDALFDPFTTIIIGLSYVAIIYFGGKYVIQQTITIGQLVSFIAYMGTLVWPMFAIGYLFNILERGNASYDRIMKMLAEQPEENPVTATQPLTHISEIKFQIADFKYPNSTREVLKNINFEVRNGETLGIVGPTGAGKSTILNLLMRDFKTYQGEITINQHNIFTYEINSYLKQIGYVPQESFLFSTTIQENIAFAQPEATLAEIQAVAQMVGLDEAIKAMPQQYAQPVKEMGNSLSGGQRQRMAMARALLLNPELLILDDSLSAVDAKTEHHILAELQKVRQNKTTLIAASRLSSVINADWIIVVQDGQIIEQGTHQQLLAQQGWYYQTYTMQKLVTEMEAE